jgi:hypothetical protein
VVWGRFGLEGLEWAVWMGGSNQRRRATASSVGVLERFGITEKREKIQFRGNTGK